MTTPPRFPAPDAIPGYTVTRWARFGHERLYVTVPPRVEAALDGTAAKPLQLGYRDLKTGADTPESSKHAAALTSVANAWLALAALPAATETPTTAPAPSAPVTPDSPPDVIRPWTDLTLNRPGAAAQKQAIAKRAEAPVKTLAARLLGVHTSERAWRIGADGEVAVARELDRLAKRDPRWLAIHAIPVGNRGSDIDHLLIGPGGIFTLNTKHHPDADVVISGDSFKVNGNSQPYIRNARHEAERATRLLTAVVGWPVHVTGLIVPVGCNAPITVKTQPRDVRVVTRRDLVEWASRLGQVLGSKALAAVHEQARRSTTWEN